MSSAALIFFLVTIYAITAIKQAVAAEGQMWTWFMAYRKFALMLAVAVSAILIALAAIAVDETILAGTTRLLAGVAIIVAIIGAVLGGVLDKFDFSKLVNFR